jgi:hypothetical protein
MSQEHFNAYMEWLFPLLFAVEDSIDLEDYDNRQKRVFGYISQKSYFSMPSTGLLTHKKYYSCGRY